RACAPAADAAPVDAHLRARHRDRQPRAGVGADRGRVDHHLPLPVPLARAARDRPGTAAPGHRQPPLAYQLEHLTTDLEVMPAAADGRLREEQKLVLAAFTELRIGDLGALVLA